MKRKVITTLTLVTTAFSTSVFAYYPGEQDQPQLPTIDSYLATAPAKPPLAERVNDQFSWLRGAYISGDVVYGFGSASLSSTPAPGAVADFTLTDNKINISSAAGNVAIGYTISPEGGPLSRVELAGMFLLKSKYNLQPIYTDPNTTNTSLNSSITSNALLLKMYWDINLDSPFIPYLVVGAGIANNSASTSAHWDALGGSVTTTDQEINSNKFAWAAGLGMRFKMNEHFYINAGYEFNSLGSINSEFNINTGVLNGAKNVELSSKTIYVNTFRLGIALQY